MRLSASTAAVFAVALVPGAALAAAELTIERITSEPSLSGIVPSPPAWSSDGASFAFLWNDAGWPTRDVFVVEGGASPRRLTGLGSSASDRSGPGVSEALWSPDGKSILFTHEGELHRVDVSSGREELVPGLPRGAYALSFSPDGAYLAFLREGDLWLFHERTGDAVQATRVAAPAIGSIPGALFSRRDAEFTSFRWSPEGTELVLVFDDRRSIRKESIPDYLAEETRVTLLRRDYPGDQDHRLRVALYDARKGRLRFVPLPGETDRRIHEARWAPAGGRLLLDRSSEDAVDRWLEVVDATARDPSIAVAWHDRNERRTSQLWASAWTSRGDGIVFVSDHEGWHHLYRLDLAPEPEPGRAARALTRGNWSVVSESGSSPLTVSPAGEVFFVSTRRSPYERHVEVVLETGGPVRAVTKLEGVHHPFVAPGGRRLVTLRSSDTSPPELYGIDLPQGEERRVTRSPPDEFYEHAWVEPEYVTFPSHVDGELLHGRLLVPPGLDREKKHPAILGPVYTNTARNRWGDREESRGLYSLFQQYLVLEGGYVILQLDVRGSVGHGRAFHERLLLDYGGIDVEDVASGAAYLSGLPYVDSERIGIWGSSYGGLLTLLSLFTKPGLYAAGVAAAPVTDFRHVTPGVAAVVRRPQSHPEAHRRGSAIHFAEGLADPLLILHGMQDSIVLFKDTVVLVEKLMKLGKDFDFALSPTATHYWSRQDHTARFLLGKIDAHFRAHLRAAPR